MAGPSCRGKENERFAKWVKKNVDLNEYETAREK